MSAYDITGTIKRIGPIEQKSEKFSKRVLILDVEDGKYPQTVEFQATGDRCSLLDQFSAGDEVSIKWNLRGREWSGGPGGPKVFNSCDIWKVDLVKKGAGQSSSSSSGQTGDIPF
jgi:hypothetical protein